MPEPHAPALNPNLDLLLERVVPVPPSVLFRAWTEPTHRIPWFCPRPRRTSSCEIDLRADGVFRTVIDRPNVLTFTPHGTSTHYRSHIMHRDAGGKAAHDAMGFHAGWNAALDQLVEDASTVLRHPLV